MYHLEKVKKEDLGKIEIRNQDEIIERTGSNLDLPKAYILIKRESKDFKEDHPKAREADRLFLELLERSGVVAGDKKKDTNQSSRIRLQEQERSRELELLELEMELEMAA